MAIRPEVLFRKLCDDLASTFGDSFVSDCDGPLWPDATPLEAAGFSIYNSFLKKIETGRTRETDRLAEEKFLKCNNTCANWALPCQYDTRIETLIGELRRSIYEFWYKDGEPLPHHPFDLLKNGSVGPGVSIGSEGCSFYAKLFSSPLTCSDSSLYNWYIRYIQRWPEWLNAENIRVQQYGSPSVRNSNRLSFVPKNDEISRCICVEPTLNTIFQSGFGRILESRLEERFGISLSTQQFDNRELARYGSIDDDVVTIDLSSASDTISLHMLREFLPRDFFEVLLKYRSPTCEVKGRGTVQLSMISTMGNGFTFPLQTMLFACAVTAAFRFRGIPSIVGGTRWLWGVNGDDIACPELIARDVIDLLTLLGFSVNSDKTFLKGPFRESCGHDYFLGRNVRGVYVKTLRSPASRYSVINLLNQFMRRTGLFLPRTLELLTSSVKYLPIPMWENVDSGIRTSFNEAKPFLEWDSTMYGFHYRCIVPRPRKVYFKEERVVVPRGNKALIYNPSGLLVSLLQGSIHGGACGVREDNIRYVTKRKFTSRHWDTELLPSEDWVGPWCNNQGFGPRGAIPRLALRRKP